MARKLEIAEIDERITKSIQKLEKAKTERVSAIERFVGTHYGYGGAEKVTPTNLLELAVTVYMRLLAARSPRAIVKTDEASLKPFAADFQIVLNQLPDEIGLGKTVRRAVLEAMFSMGIVKVGVAGIDPRPNFGDEPFVSIVQMDDYFVDMSAKSWDEIQYEGNEYWMDTEDIKEFYGVELPGDEYVGQSTEGVKQARAITNDDTGCELYERVRLRDVYLVKENRMLTYAVDSKQVLRDIPWDGPEGTPYLKLWFEEVPGNLLPLAPTAIWSDLHDLSNKLYRKIANQAVARKTVVIFQGGNDQEAARFNGAKDGDAITYSGTKPEEVSVGGVDQGALALYLQNNSQMSRFAGNLDSLGGLSPMSSTASQDKLINESASARISDMGDQVNEFVKEIFRRLAWYVWTDPVRERKYRKVHSQKFNVGIDKKWTPETRDGDFIDYNFDIAPFSMQDDSPSTRVRKLSEVMQQFVFPLQQMMMQQGYVIDMKEMLAYVSQNSNLPELADIVKQMGQPAVAQGPSRESAGLPQPSYVSTKPAYSHRVYERVNRPGKMTEDGKNAVLANVLMGGNVQPSELAGATGGNMM